ncbi:RNA polymerase alpha subunit C-terminal domain-containing protein [Solibacillus sp. FSL R5-0691]|uniref:RNA polymerase alpha subunit C-terminal domain-containing protein n=1 Tax=Solibacillus sp. FSL W7-1324 TaxID=2921701 RepID=UPI0030D52AC6
MKRERTLRICPKGHRYYKSTDCGTCPKCEQANKPSKGFLSRLTSPARNALINAGITELEQLAEYTESEILQLHGIGPSSMPKLKQAMAEKSLNFKS